MRQRSLSGGVAYTLLAIVLAWAATWGWGGPASEAALAALDQRRLDAYAAHLAARVDAPPRQQRPWIVAGVSVLERIPLPLLFYYRSQSLVEGSAISCGAPRSIVVWYGLNAVVLWQDGAWGPGRDAAVRRRATTGYAP
jgi:hypothetical protein